MAASSTRHIEPLLPTAAPSSPSWIGNRYTPTFIARRYQHTAFRGRRWDTTRPQLNPPYLFEPIRARRITRQLPCQHVSLYWEVIPKQQNPPYPHPTRVTRSRRGFIPRHGQTWGPYIPQQNPPIKFPPISRRSITRQIRPTRRPQTWQPIPPQRNPIRAFTLRVTRLRRNFLPRRSQRFDTIPAQLAPPVAPAFPFTLHITRRRRNFLPRRGHEWHPTSAQVTVPPPVLTPSLIRALRRAKGLIRRLRRYDPFHPPLTYPPDLFVEPTYGTLLTDGSTSATLLSNPQTYSVLASDGTTSSSLVISGQTFGVLKDSDTGTLGDLVT